MVLAALSPVLSALPMSGEGDGHFPPEPQDFWQPLFAIPGTGFYFTRSMAAIAFSAILLSWWLVRTTRNVSVVPSRGQHYTELVYNFIRNDIAKDSIGAKDFLRFVPLLFALFVFILLNNLFGIIPPIQMPTMSRVAYPIALTAIVYVVYHWVGIKKHHGIVNYIKWMIPPGLPAWLLPLVVPLELMTFFINRPLTLALRLFGNMFAGHMLLVVFIVGGWELFTSDSIGLKFVALPAWLMAVVMTLFEALIQFLQAYVFVLLAASYFSDAVSGEH